MLAAWLGPRLVACHGVTTANLVSRALRDLVQEHETALSPFSRDWVVRAREPKPLRWAGTCSLEVAEHAAQFGGRLTMSARARFADVIAGR